MRAFLFALVFFCAVAVVTGAVFVYGLGYPAHDAYSLDSARVGESGAANREGWNGGD